MDTDIIAAIVGVVIASFLGWAENRARKVKRAKAMNAARKPGVERQRAQVSPDNPFDFIEKQEVRDNKPKPAYRFTAEEEASALSPQKRAAEHVGASMPQSTVSREELRKAVIWSEILKPKF